MRRNFLPAIPGLLLLAGCHDLPTDVPGGAGITPQHVLVAGPVTPTFGGNVTSAIVTLDSRAGQRRAMISPDGDLVCYDDDITREVRYHRFSTGVNVAVTKTDPNGTDLHCATDGSRIAFIRLVSTIAERHVSVFDPATSAFTPIDPIPGAQRDEVAIAGSTVAFVNALSNGWTEIRGADLAAPGSSQLIHSAGANYGVRLSPQGNVLVWNKADISGTLDAYMSVRTGTTWGAATTPAGIAANLSVGGTDGFYIAYTGWDNDTFEDVFIQEVTGGPIMQVEMPGSQLAFSIDGGVIGILHNTPGSSNWDVMVYNIATNTILQVTNTPDLENAPSVGVLSNGNIRVVWQGVGILSTTFTPAGGPVAPPGPTFTFGGFKAPVSGPPALNVRTAGATTPVKFSLGGNHGLSIFAPGSPYSTPIDCNTLAPVGSPTPTVGAGNNPLSYDAVTGTYTYHWKSDSNWRNCRQLTLRFVDGTQASANFRFN